jgi:signal transduction histidine kinase
MNTNEVEQLKKQIEIQEQEITILNEKMSKFEIVRSEFLSNIRNEIVNPFSSIQILSKMIVKSNKNDWKAVISMAALIQKEALTLDFHLKNIFAAAELESGDSQVSLSNAKIVGIFQNIIDTYEPLAHKKSIEMKLESTLGDEDTILADVEKIKLILANLITNSINACNTHSEIIVELKMEENRLIFSVYDNGIGISDAARASIFNRFNKLDKDINSENPGLGIGLSIVLSCVDLLDGEIHFDSLLDHFSKFTISLPIQQNSDLYTDMIESDNELMFF